MRMILPPLRQRRAIDRNLADFFRLGRALAFRKAIAEFCRFYNLKLPRIEWYEYIDWGKTAGKTFEDGRIHLIHPENWKRGRVYFSERKWIAMVYHEMGHFLFWSHPETKADSFTRRMLLGLSASPAKSARVASRRGPANRKAAPRHRDPRTAALRATRSKRARKLQAYARGRGNRRAA
ncbi:MAG TPA: hypothetical protein VGI47_09330 [Candidatus Binataceae bacterium]